MAREVVVREVEDDDLPAFFEQQRDPEAVRMAAFASRDREAFDAHWARIRGEPDVLLRTIVADGRVAGNVVSFVRDGRTMVGYWLGREFWGRGIATRALRQFLAQQAVRPLYADVATHNLGSIRVLEKCGFAVIGEEVIPAAAAGAEEAVPELIMELRAELAGEPG